MSLRFPSEIIPGVRDGSVTMQFGIWKRPRVVAGRVYVIKGLGTVRVTAVEKVDLSRLTPWEAQAAGAKDVAELKAWLAKDYPEADPDLDQGFRVRFRYLGPKSGEPEDDDGVEPTPAEDPTVELAPSPVPPKAVPRDLMIWLEKRPWRKEHLGLLSNGIWRNADDLSEEIGADSPTTRRRMGDLRKRGLVTSHRHHGYRITSEGQGALAGLVDDDTDGAGTSAADWLKGKKGRSDLLAPLEDGRWHNAAEIGEVLGLSVVSVQRRVAALRDRGLVESHRRRGYRLTEVGFEALGLMPKTDGTPDDGDEPTAVFSPPDGTGTPPMPVEPDHHTLIEPKRRAEPIPADLLEWLEAKPYRKDLILAISPDDYVSSTELSETLTTSVTAIHGRLNTMKVRGLVTSLPRRGYMLTPLGLRASEVIQVMAMRRNSEPEGASAFLSAEPEGWTGGPVMVKAQGTATTTPAPASSRKRVGSKDVCGFCGADANTSSRPGWMISLQTYLEDRESEGSKVDPIPCHRGVMEDASWLLVVDRNPLAEGHCKLICKEHVTDLLELSEWSHTDQRLAQVRDVMTRDLMLAADIISKLDDRIIDVMVMTGLEQGSHMHFELIPRYRMDLPGLRPLAAAKGHYDDLSLTRKRKLWQSRGGHLEEVAGRLRTIARGAIIAQGQSGMYVTDV